MKILNLTQHNATPEQVEQGVFDMEANLAADVRGMLTFNSVPSTEELFRRANSIAQIAEEEGAKYAMIGGAPYFMAPLEGALLSHGITPLYAFSLRESKDVHLEDGSVKKTMVFRHIGFVGMGGVEE